ncbi:hypothetical protein CH063_15102, partial [Colletotrichum higginsianum]
VAYCLIACVSSVASSGLQLTNCRGVFVYTVLNGLIALTVWLSGGRLEPREYDAKEYWSWRGSGKKPWFVRAVRTSCFSNGDHDSKRQFNMQDDHESSYAPGSRMGSSDHKEDGVHMVTIPQRAVTPRSVH